MGVLDLFKKATAPLSRRFISRGADEDLFDDEFQRKLDYLAVVARLVAGPGAPDRRYALAAERAADR